MREPPGKPEGTGPESFQVGDTEMWGEGARRGTDTLQGTLPTSRGLRGSRVWPFLIQGVTWVPECRELL